MFDWLHPSHQGSPAAWTPARTKYWRKLKAREFKSAAPPHAAARPHIFENKWASAFVRWKTHFHLLPEGVTRRLLVWCRCRPGDHQMEAKEKERLRKRGWGEEGERKRKIEIDFQGSNWEQKRLPRDSSSGFAFYGGKNKQNERSNRFTNLKEKEKGQKRKTKGKEKS